MAKKQKERRRLLRLYDVTGDEDYKKAADCLRSSLLEDLNERQRRPGHRGPTVGREARPRLYRIARRVAGGMTVNAAAVEEVASHGRGKHKSDCAAIDYLRREYKDNRESIEGTIAAFDQMRQGWLDFERHCASFAELQRTALSSLPPATLPLWARISLSMTRMIRNPMPHWRNTRPKNDE